MIRVSKHWGCGVMLRAEHMSLGCIGTEWQMEMYGLPQIIMQYNVKMKRA